MGFNAMQPGKIKRGDLIFLIAAIVVIGALLAWAFFGLWPRSTHSRRPSSAPSSPAADVPGIRIGSRSGSSPTTRVRTSCRTATERIGTGTSSPTPRW